MVGLPVMVSGWSGQMDFLDQENSITLGGKLKEVPQSAVWKNIILKESKWFNVDENLAYKSFNYIFKEYDEAKAKAKILMKKNRKLFTLKKMSERLNEMTNSYVNHQQSSQVSLKLPKLKKVDESANKALPKLPKLKKI